MALATPVPACGSVRGRRRLHHTVDDIEENTAMDWRHRALCRDEDPELFFPIGTTGPSLVQIEQAKGVCRRCPVTESCLDRKSTRLNSSHANISYAVFCLK